MIVKIPFVEHIGIDQESNKQLKLDISNKVSNHIGTMHAGAMFTLAETQSGVCLMEHFSHFKEVIPLLRSGTIKYKKQAGSEIYAVCSIKDEDIRTFETKFKKRLWGTIEVKVYLKDRSDSLCAEATFVWMIQKEF